MLRISRKQAILGSATAVWTVCCVIGVTSLWRYSARAGEPSSAPNAWPAASRLVRTPEKLTLIMALHPQCPCSVASVRELERLLAEHSSSIETNVLLVKPTGAPSDWNDTRLAKLAASLPTVHIIDDADAAEARRFGLRTSGAVLLYGRDGQIRFTGGITAMRGHEGDNDSLDALTAAIDSMPKSPVNTSVFGCPLESTDATKNAAPAVKMPEVTWAQ